MPNDSKNRIMIPALLCLCLLFFSVVFQITVCADTGPKPSLIIDFTNLGGEICYGTVLSDEWQIGPLHVYYPEYEATRLTFVEGYESDDIPEDFESDIWSAFVEFKDPDGFHFLQLWTNVSEIGGIHWNWWAPSKFKVLLYYPESGRYAVSGICERYAYDSYYTIDMALIDFSQSDTADGTVGSIPSVTKANPYPWEKEILPLLARISITIGLEIGVALIFRLWQKRTLLVISVTNVLTQVMLNLVALNINVYWKIWKIKYQYVRNYLMLEAAVFVVECIVYSLVLNKFTDKRHKPWFYAAYSLAANVLSFVAGILLSYVIPDIF